MNAIAEKLRARQEERAVVESICAAFGGLGLKSADEEEIRLAGEKAANLALEIRTKETEKLRIQRERSLAGQLQVGLDERRKELGERLNAARQDPDLIRLQGELEMVKLPLGKALGRFLHERADEIADKAVEEFSTEVERAQEEYLDLRGLIQGQNLQGEDLAEARGEMDRLSNLASLAKPQYRRDLRQRLDEIRKFEKIRILGDHKEGIPPEDENLVKGWKVGFYHQSPGQELQAAFKVVLEKLRIRESQLGIPELEKGIQDLRPKPFLRGVTLRDIENSEPEPIRFDPKSRRPLPIVREPGEVPDLGPAVPLLRPGMALDIRLRPWHQNQKKGGEKEKGKGKGKGNKKAQN